jgi:hypothetical protein
MKEMRKGAPVEVVRLAEVRSSSRKDSGSSLRKTKGSSITQLGRGAAEGPATAAAMIDLTDLWNRFF